MLRMSMLVAALSVFAVPALAAPPIELMSAGVVAKAPKKKEDKKKEVEKPPERLQSDPRSSSAGADNGMSSEVRRGMARIEFDDRLIKGQTNKANAIYLFERRESALRSLLKKRSHFHEEIDETLE